MSKETEGCGSNDSQPYGKVLAVGVGRGLVGISECLTLITKGSNTYDIQVEVHD